MTTITDNALDIMIDCALDALAAHCNDDIDLLLTMIDDCDADDAAARSIINIIDHLTALAPHYDDDAMRTRLQLARNAL